ncbi:hypothetical protein [Streptomyces jumonjinensis]|uniref:Uncharacterized protein n=1 Tax=Streptomyces jumonjinensis TaxID=1945 RepID=A0A646KIN0_STRJU|nr:hypothetical protein [Streptomyces jumonjinensis]MQT01918.1 hypothetical protein [Streptomyces jumonjinensis]
MGHSFTSGHDIPLDLLLPAFPPITALAWLAGSRRRGALTIGLGLLAAQGGLHLHFAQAQLHGPAPVSASAPVPLHGAAPPAAHALAADAPLLGPSPVAMVAAHLLAAAFCAVWLSHGETAFLKLVRAVGALAFTPLRPPLTAAPLPGAPKPAGHRRRAARPRRQTLLLGHTLIRRGPPVLPAPRATAPGATV